MVVWGFAFPVFESVVSGYENKFIDIFWGLINLRGSTYVIKCTGQLLKWASTKFKANLSSFSFTLQLKDQSAGLPEIIFIVSLLIPIKLKARGIFWPSRCYFMMMFIAVNYYYLHKSLNSQGMAVHFLFSSLVNTFKEEHLAYNASWFIQLNIPTSVAVPNLGSLMYLSKVQNYSLSSHTMTPSFNQFHRGNIWIERG